MYEFCYDYVKPKYGENAKLCYMDTDSFIVHVKTDNIYKDIAEDFETSFGTSDFEIVIPLPKEKNKNANGLMQDKLGGQIMTNNKLILKTQQRFKSERHNISTEEINKIALSSNDDKRMRSVDSIETYEYGTSKDLTSKKEKNKLNNIIKLHKKV